MQKALEGLSLTSRQDNPDGQDQTNFGALAAYEVPWIVIPDKFGTHYQSILAGNNIGAVHLVRECTFF